jgi:hypothetical protein
MAFSNPILTGGGPSQQSIHETVTDQRHAVGTRGQLPDGRVYYYARNSSTALTKGQLVQSMAADTDYQNINPSAAAAVGATEVAITLGGSNTFVVGEYEGGWLIVSDAAGEGETYRILSNTAATGTAITVYLDDSIRVALTTSSEVCIQKNPNADTVIAAAGHVHNAAGIPGLDVAVGTTAAPVFYWLQTWGTCAGWDDAATAVGAPLQSGATAGQVEVNDGAAQLIGTQLVVGVATEYRPKSLCIAP